MSGFSGTPLANKLGIKPGCRLRVTAPPDDYADLVAPLPDGVSISTTIRRHIDIWHYFTTSRAELERALPILFRGIEPNGMIWISWPKKSSGVPATAREWSLSE